MYCGILETVTTASQAVTAGGSLLFATNKVQRCLPHTAGSSTVTLSQKGIYNITFNGDVTPTTSGSVTVAIYNGTTQLAATTFDGTSAEATHVTLATLIEVLPSCAIVNNSANITVQVADAGTVANADLIVEKVRQ